MGEIVFWIFIFGGGTILTDFLSNLHKQKMKKIEIQALAEANRAKELEIIAKYGKSYFENKDVIQERLFESALGDNIRIDNNAQKDILKSYEEGKEF